jgi:hypothetical protein
MKSRRPQRRVSPTYMSSHALVEEVKAVSASYAPTRRYWVIWSKESLSSRGIEMLAAS